MLNIWIKGLFTRAQMERYLGICWRFSMYTFWTQRNSQLTESRMPSLTTKTYWCWIMQRRRMAFHPSFPLNICLYVYLSNNSPVSPSSLQIWVHCKIGFAVAIRVPNNACSRRSHPFSMYLCLSVCQCLSGLCISLGRKPWNTVFMF